MLDEGSSGEPAGEQGQGAAPGPQCVHAETGSRVEAISRANSIRLGLRSPDDAGVANEGTAAGTSRSLQAVAAPTTLANGIERAGTLGEQYCKPEFGTLATCAIVGLDLAQNNLHGSLSYAAPPGTALEGESSGGDGLCVFTALQTLSISGNLLEGDLPRAGISSTNASTCLPVLRTLDIAHNRISGPMPLWVISSDLSSITLNGNLLSYPAKELVSACFGRAGRQVACSGVPPMSCRAFGEEWQLKADSPNECVQCSLEEPWPLVVLIAVLSAFLLFGATYAMMMMCVS